MAKIGNDIVAVLDIGSTKIVCFIATVSPDSAVNIIGIGHQVSKGIKAGIITDIKLAEESIKAVVATAEKMAGVNIDKILVNISGCRDATNIVTVEMPVSGKEISNRDITRIIEDGCRQFKTAENELIHCVPVDYAIDGRWGIRDPIGMFGNMLAVTLNVITAPTSVIYNLANCLARCHLDVEDFAISPYASALACLSEDERELGCIVIDFGGANTSVAVFAQGALAYVDVVNLGGMNITNDIAICYSTNLQVAERLKTLHGSLAEFARDSNELIEIPVIEDDGERTDEHIQKSALTEVIKPRVEEIFEMVRDSIAKSGYAGAIGKIKITGGSSQIAGLKDFASKFFDKQVRLAVPHEIDGMAESTKGPAFATSVGILNYAIMQRKNGVLGYGSRRFGLKNLVLLASRWVKKNF